MLSHTYQPISKCLVIERAHAYLKIETNILYNTALLLFNI